MMCVAAMQASCAVPGPTQVVGAARVVHEEVPVDPALRVVLDVKHDVVACVNMQDAASSSAISHGRLVYHACADTGEAHATAEKRVLT